MAITVTHQSIIEYGLEASQKNPLDLMTWGLSTLLATFSTFAIVPSSSYMVKKGRGRRRRRERERRRRRGRGEEEEEEKEEGEDEEEEKGEE